MTLKNLVYYKTASGSIGTIPIRPNIPLPIENIYFHNLDSIFLFFNREYVVKNSDSENQLADFVLINNQGAILNMYSLDSVPYIYNGQVDPMIFQSPEYIRNQRLIGDHLLIPFSTYRPGPHEERYQSWHPSLLCSYNLKTGQVKMLNVRLPFEDLGSKLSFSVQHILTNRFEFSFGENGELLLSFLYSPSVYAYDFSDDTLVRVTGFDECFFNNFSSEQPSSEMGCSFEPPFYCRDKNIYLRRINVRKYYDYDPFRIVQVFDRKFRSRGYVLQADGHGALNCFDDRTLVFDMNNRIWMTTSFSGSQKIPIDEFHQKLKRPSTKQQPVIKTDQTMEVRMEEYLQELGIPDSSLVVLISSEYLCAHCLNHLMDLLEKNYDQYKESSVFYLITTNSEEQYTRLFGRYKNVKPPVVLNDFILHHSLFPDVELAKDYLIITNTDGIVIHRNKINTYFQQLDLLIKNQTDQFKKSK